MHDAGADAGHTHFDPIRTILQLHTLHRENSNSKLL